MIIAPNGGGGSRSAGSSDEPTTSARDNKFGISGNGANFGPFFMPERISVTKERNLVRHANFCGLEDVFEVHGHNREIHISGKLRESELPAFARILDHNQPADLETPGWEGEVRVVKGEHEGPIGWEPQTGQYLYEYSLDLVSTGVDEAQHLRFYNAGILQDGLGNPLQDVTDEEADLLRGR